MRSRLLVFVLVLLTLCSVAKGALILEAGFEADELGASPGSPWDSQAGRRLTIVDEETGLVHEGDQAVMLTEAPGNGGGGGWGNVLRQVVSGLEPGGACVVSAWVNIREFELAGGSEGVRLSLLDEGGALSSVTTGAGVTDGWVELNTSAYVPASGELALQLEESGRHTLRAYVDSIRVSSGAAIPEPHVACYVALAGVFFLGRRSGKLSRGRA